MNARQHDPTRRPGEAVALGYFRNSAMAAALACGLPGTPACAQACPQRLQASAPLRDDDGFISLPATIGGTSVSLLVDTGSDNGMLTKAGAARLGLRRDPGRRVVLQGTGGDGPSAAVASYSDLRIGGLLLPAGSLPVSVLPGMPVLEPPIAGLIGADLLSRYDVEFDLRRHRIGFWTAATGSAACAGPPGWRPPFETIPLTRLGDRMALTVRLDGQPISALLDTGARSRILSTQAAARLGVDAKQLGLDPGGVTAGIDLHESVYHWHRFRSLVIGAETFDRPILTVAPLDDRVDLLLGADWFAGHDVWIDWATNRLFVRPG